MPRRAPPEASPQGPPGNWGPEAVDASRVGAYISVMNNAETFTVDLVSPVLRGFNAFIFLVVASSQFFLAGDRGVSVAGILILAVTLLGTLLEERWSFDPGSETARFRFGLLFAAHVRTIPFAEISAVEFDDFEKGFNKQKWTRIILRVPGGKDEIIDTVNRKRAGALIAKAERLADFFAARRK